MQQQRFFRHGFFCAGLLAFSFLAGCQSAPQTADDGIKWQTVGDSDPIFAVQQQVANSCTQTDVPAGFVGVIRLQPLTPGDDTNTVPPFDSPTTAEWDNNYQTFVLYLLGLFGEEIARVDLAQDQPAKIQSPYPLPAEMHGQSAGFVNALDALGPQGLRNLVCGQYAFGDMKQVKIDPLNAGLYSFNSEFKMGDHTVNAVTKTSLVPSSTDDGDLFLDLIMESELTTGVFHSSVGRVVWRGSVDQSDDPGVQARDLVVLLEDQAIFLWFMEYQ